MECPQIIRKDERVADLRTIQFDGIAETKVLIDEIRTGAGFDNDLDAGEFGLIAILDHGRAVRNGYVKSSGSGQTEILLQCIRIIRTAIDEFSVERHRVILNGINTGIQSGYLTQFPGDGISREGQFGEKTERRFRAGEGIRDRGLIQCIPDRTVIVQVIDQRTYIISITLIITQAVNGGRECGVTGDGVLRCWSNETHQCYRVGGQVRMRNDLSGRYSGPIHQ